MSERHTKPSDPVAGLVRLAGPRTPVPEETVARSRAVVREAWLETVHARSRRRRTGWAIAAGMITAVTLSATLGSDVLRRLIEPPVTVGTVESTIGTGLGGKLSSLGQELKAGDVLETADGLVSMRLSGGASLRLDADTRLRWIGDQEMRLERGAVYLDAGPDDAQLLIHTPFGIVRDIGTQFEARLSDRGLRIRVREGEVEVQKGRRRSAVKQGTEMTVQADGEVERRPVEVHGEPWRRYQAVAPAFQLDGASLADYLSWLSRETGWILNYRDADIPLQAPTVILHGVLRDVPVSETPEIVLPTCRLESELRDGILEIRRIREGAR